MHPAGAGDHGKTGSKSAIAGVALGNEPKAACRTLSSAAQPEVIGHGAGINADFTLGHDLEIVPDIVLAANDLTSLVINEPHLASQRRAVVLADGDSAEPDSGPALTSQFARRASSTSYQCPIMSSRIKEFQIYDL